MYACKNGVHNGDKTITDFLSLYEKAKYFYGWIDMVFIFKKEGQKRFYREHELETSDTPCKWCGKQCGGSCSDAKAYICEPIKEIDEINKKYNNLTD
jgi:hypothetical protein